MRIEAECPACGAIVKQETSTGRFAYQGWSNANPCQNTDGEPFVEELARLRGRKLRGWTPPPR